MNCDEDRFRRNRSEKGRIRTSALDLVDICCRNWSATFTEDLVAAHIPPRVGIPRLVDTTGKGKASRILARHYSACSSLVGRKPQGIGLMQYVIDRRKQGTMCRRWIRKADHLLPRMRVREELYTRQYAGSLVADTSGIELPHRPITVVGPPVSDPIREQMHTGPIRRRYCYGRMIKLSASYHCICRTTGNPVPSPWEIRIGHGLCLRSQ